MNMIELINRIAGIAFAVALTAFLGYRAYLWRNDMAKEAGKRLQHRIVQMSDDPRYQLPVMKPAYSDVKISPDTWKGFTSGYPGQPKSR